MSVRAFLRPVTKEDLDALVSFSHDVGYGFTTLPKDRKLLEEKISESERSFHKGIFEPRHESYLFVLEYDKKVIGCSSIISRIAMTEPFYAYHQLKASLKKETTLLHFLKAHKKPTEICTLFLEKPYRGKKNGYGLLLSFSRFLFIASHTWRFAEIVIAQMRGVSDEKGRSPFWEAIGRHFFDMSFDEAQRFKLTKPECIEEFFPPHPIYPLLLSQEAQEVIGKVHPETIPALKILRNQGFSLTHYLDIFDAGPHLFCHTNEILAVKKSQERVVGTIVAGESGYRTLVSNTRIDFRAAYGEISMDDKGEVTLSQELADVLNIEKGEKVRIYDAHFS